MLRLFQSSTRSLERNCSRRCCCYWQITCAPLSVRTLTTAKDHAQNGGNNNNSSDASTQVASRLAVGSHKWTATEDRKAYQDVIHTALANGIATLEVGPEGGDVLMSEVLSTIASQEQQQQNDDTTTKKPPPPPRIELLQRVGYRLLPKHKQGMTGDVPVPPSPSEKDNSSGSGGSSSKTVGTVQHNISVAALQTALYDSYLQHAPSACWKTTRTLLLHNPEVQITDHDLNVTQRQEQLRVRLKDSFLYLQEACLEQQQQEQAEQRSDGKHHNMRGYGIVSNGLGLPDNHPLHVSWTDAVLPALQDVHSELGMNKDKPCDFRVLQLPVNLLETNGLRVAQQVHSDRNALDELSSTKLKIIAMRPLTCYPDLGTGDGKPFILADYQLPATMDKTLQWTQDMEQPPAVYQVALKTAMAHFDASEMLELKQQGIELSTEQRETLDGCKLMQSLLHDVDASLENVRSFAQHEQDLYERIIPLIHDTFEGYDEETGQIMQSFFGAYSLAVRYAIAKNTRKLLVEGEGKDRTSSSSSSSIQQAPTYADLSPHVPLQEYAMHFLLKAGCIDKLLVGFTEPDQILQDMDIVAKASKMFQHSPHPTS